MKTLRIALLLFCISFELFGQNGIFKSNPKIDAEWIKKLVKIKNNQNQLAVKNEPDCTPITWVTGKVLYSPDKRLRIGQLIGRFDNSEQAYYNASIQYFYQNKVIENELIAEGDDFDFQTSPISSIHKLPGSNPTYLIISTEVEKSINNDGTQDLLADFMKRQKEPTEIELPNIQNIYHLASVVSINKGKLKALKFNQNDDELDYNYVPQLKLPLKTLEINSIVNIEKDCPKPFFKYNPVNQELSFLQISYEHEIGETSNDLYNKIYSGTFKYEDSAFTLVRDSSYFYPELKSLTHTLLIKDYNVGNYVIKAIARKKYQENEYGHDVFKVLDVEYKINSDTIGYVIYDYEDENDTTKIDITPDCKLQKDSSLLFLVTSLTNDHRPGECGSCDYENYTFWRIGKNEPKLLFSVTANSSGRTDYENNSGELEQSGTFYLQKDSTDFYMVDSTYWKNDSTYVFKYSDGNFYRNYYIYFEIKNRKAVSRLEIGELLAIKDEEEPLENK